jgi:alpha-L-fucosidase 2
MARGINSNPYYQLDQVPAPLMASSASVKEFPLPVTYIYDLPTVAGCSYTLYGSAD